MVVVIYQPYYQSYRKLAGKKVTQRLKSRSFWGLNWEYCGWKEILKCSAITVQQNETFKFQNFFWKAISGMS